MSAMERRNLNFNVEMSISVNGVIDVLKKFRGYIPYTDQEKKDIWRKCVFVFDTNFLLNLYRYSVSTKKRFFTILNKLNGNIWLPNQVAEEYFRNRCKVLYDQHQLYQKINKAAEFSDMNSLLNEYQDRHSLIDTREILKIVDKASNDIKEIIGKIEDEDKDIPYNNDDICTNLLKLFDNRVGDEYKEETLKSIYCDGEKRFKNNIPPGYMDKKKDGNRKYGDLIIWKQILDYAKEKQKPIVFVTADVKDDWWESFGGKKIGPRIQLTQEMYSQAGVDFLMYQPKQFLQQASTQYKITESGLEKAMVEVEKLEDLEKNNTTYMISDYNEFKRSSHLFLPYMFKICLVLDGKVSEEIIRNFRKNLAKCFQSNVILHGWNFSGNAIILVFRSARKLRPDLEKQLVHMFYTEVDDR